MSIMMLAMDVLLIVLLGAGIFLVVRLNRNLDILRAGRAEMKDFISNFTSTIKRAETATMNWRMNAQEIASELDPLLHKAELTRDELALLIASGDQIANRLTDVATAAARQTAAATSPLAINTSIKSKLKDDDAQYNTLNKQKNDDNKDVKNASVVKFSASDNKSAPVTNKTAPRAQSSMEQELLRMLESRRS